MFIKLKSLYLSRCIPSTLIILFFLASCARAILTSKIGDGGLISGKPCSAPCFLGILPGITIRDKAIDSLKQQGVYKYCKDNIDSSYINCDDRFSVYYYPKGYLISYVIFTPPSSLTVQNVLDKYGSPDSVYVERNSDITEHTSVSMDWGYNKLHLLLGLSGQGGMTYSLKQDTRIVSIQYNDEGTYDELEKVLTEYLVVWKGMGPY